MDRFDFTDGDFLHNLGGGIMMDSEGHIRFGRPFLYMYFTKEKKCITITTDKLSVVDYNFREEL